MAELDYDALRKAITAGRLAPIHVLVGEDARLIDQTLDLLEATIDPADRPFAVERLYAGEAGGAPVDIAAAARALPMLGDRRLVFVMRAERLLKPKRAGRPADVEEDEDAAEAGAEAEPVDLVPLEDYLAGPLESSTLVFVASAVDRGRRFTKALLQSKAAAVTWFEGLTADGPAARRESRERAETWVKEEMARAGRTIAPAAVRLLVDRAGLEASRLRGDIERLLLYTEGQSRISLEDAAEVASAGIPVDDDWAVINAIGAGQAGQALVEIAKRFDRGDSPHQLLGQLRWWVSTRLVERHPERVRPAIDALLRTDLALKSSGGDPRMLLERLVAELATRPVV